MTPNKSLQATRDGVSGSAIAEDVIRPACLSSLGGLSVEDKLNKMKVSVSIKGDIQHIAKFMP